MSPFFSKRINLNMNDTLNIEDFLLKDTQNILRLPCHCENKQTGGKWDIYPMTVAQMAEAYPYLSKIEKSDLDELQTIIESGDGGYKISDYLKFYAAYHELIEKIVHIIVGRDISDVATNEDYMYMFIATIYRMGSQSFLKSINLARKLSLSSKAGLIAAEKRYTTSLNL